MPARAILEAGRRIARRHASAEGEKRIAASLGTRAPGWRRQG